MEQEKERNHENWCEKYRCNFLADIKGQEQAITEFKDFLKNFPQKKAAILHGPAGIGKTTIVHALAKELGLEILELNASDLRNREQLEKTLGQAAQQQSLFSKGKIILADEVDGISAADRGGLPTLIDLIQLTSFPIIMTCNNIWDSKFSQLRNKSRLIPLKEISPLIVEMILRNIALREKSSITPELLKEIAIKSSGDIRAAINDLQAASDSNLSLGELDERNKSLDIFKAMKKILKEKESVPEIFDSVDMPIDEIFLWMEENVPYEYRGEELASAFDKISRADVFRGRIYRQQHWRFLIYENLLLSEGIMHSKPHKKVGFTTYKKPGRILKIWMHNQKNEKKKTITEKYAEFCHMSKRKARREFIFAKSFLKLPAVQQQLKLEPEEVEFMNSLV